MAVSASESKKQSNVWKTLHCVLSKR